MRINSFFYCLWQGIVNIKRNKLFSLASISTIAACIFLIGIFYSIVVNVDYMIDQAEEQLCITVFFDDDLNEEQIKEKGRVIGQRVEIADMKFTSADEAWENFKRDYFADAEELADGFADDNPLANSASYSIYLNDATMQNSLVDYLKNLEGVRKVNASQGMADTISDFSKIVGYISAAIIIILFSVGVFLISNTIMVGISVRKEEIGIMKLIGATDFFVSLPFLVEGIIIGIIGALIPVIAIYIVYEKTVPYIKDQFTSITSSVEFVPVNTVMGVLIPMALIVGAGIGFLGSRITIRKHLRV